MKINLMIFISSVKEQKEHNKTELVQRRDCINQTYYVHQHHTLILNLLQAD
ncbi:MAG: hypothetical protein K0Q73_3567 [Paenibacillus sp.]|nr:hypothetical protein [Paenibacillus sp.]